MTHGDHETNTTQHGADDRRIPVAIVEDQHAIAEMLTEVLEASGFHPVLMPLPVTPEAIRESGAHIVVLDVMLPDQTGWDVLEQLRSDDRTRELPVVISSAVYDRPGLHALPPGGPVRFVPKPFDIAELVSGIRDLVAR